MPRERDQLGHVGWSPDFKAPGFGPTFVPREVRPTVDQRKQLSAELLALIARARQAGLRLCVGIGTPHGRVVGGLTADTFLGAWPDSEEPPA